MAHWGSSKNLSASSSKFLSLSSRFRALVVAQKLNGNDLLKLFDVSEIDELISTQYECELKCVRDILLILGRECQTNFEQFIIDDEQSMEAFKEIKQLYFSGGFGVPKQISSIIVQTISELRMTPK